MDLDSTLLFGVLVAVALAFALRSFRHDRERREQRLVRDAIVAYFQKLGLFVSVFCCRTREGLVALIEAEPDKKFRFSYLKERAVAEHVAKTTRKRIDCVYWRFRGRKGTTLPREYQEFETQPPPAPFPSPTELGRAMARDLDSFAGSESNVKSFEQALRARARLADDSDLPPFRSA
jgi:hypothetical protein